MKMKQTDRHCLGNKTTQIQSKYNFMHLYTKFKTSG